MANEIDLSALRSAMARFELSPKVEPNEIIEPQRVFSPHSHRGVLDLKRQLVVGNRGVGKSFWTHALLSSEIRTLLASFYKIPVLSRMDVVVGFNGSEKLGAVAPTIEELSRALKSGIDPETIWRAVFLRAIRIGRSPSNTFPSLQKTIEELSEAPEKYALELSQADNELTEEKKTLVVVFDALDRLADNWSQIRKLTKALLIRVLGLQSFRSIRAKIFMRADQFSDPELFRFPDGSKIKNDYVNLSWKPHELYGLLFFELARDPKALESLSALEREFLPQTEDSTARLLKGGDLSDYATLVSIIAGEFMGGHKKRGRVFTWVPLHLSDAANSCSPRTFLTAWKSAAEHVPAPLDRVVDHLGLIEGVRHASATRLAELREDYPWIDIALEPLRRQFVPILRRDLFKIWDSSQVLTKILEAAQRSGWLAPISLLDEQDPTALLQAMSSIAVMEERSNEKINVPDIFRVEAGILRKGGVAVPRRG